MIKCRDSGFTPLREDRPAPGAAQESDATGQQQSGSAAGLRAARLLSDRRGVAAPRTGRRDAPLLLILGPRAERRSSAAHAQCTVATGPEWLKVWDRRSRLLPRLGRSREGREGAELAGGGMWQVTRPIPHGLHKRCPAAAGSGSAAGGTHVAGSRGAAGRRTRPGPRPVARLPRQSTAQATPGGSQQEERSPPLLGSWAAFSGSHLCIS